MTFFAALPALWLGALLLTALWWLWYARRERRRESER